MPTSHLAHLEIARDVGQRFDDEPGHGGQDQRHSETTDHFEVPPSTGWAAGPRAATASSTSTQRSAASSTTAATAGERPMPSRNSAGWQPTITMRPTEPPSRASVARTTSGPIVWASTMGTAVGSATSLTPGTPPSAPAPAL